MNLSRVVKTLVVAGIVAVFACGLAACKSDPSSGVAATVNGTEISEQKVTDQIEHVRAQSGLTDDEQWGKFLVQNDMTPQSVRETIIDTMVEQELIKQGAKDLGLSVEESEVDEAINSFKENYNTEEAWKDALKQAGFTEDTYHETIMQSMLEKKVGDYFEEQSEATEEEYVQSAQTYASYYDGAKHVSEILFGVEDTSNTEQIEAAKTQAAEVAAQITSGSLDFADAAKQYSTDEASAENGGDIGWDKIADFDEAIVTALTDLEAGQMSEPTEGAGGVFIVKVTEVYKAPEDTSTITSLDQIPEAFRENIKEMAVSVQANTKYTEWLDELKENADKVINDMPSGLPYDIDLTPYQNSEDSADADAAATDPAATDPAATGDEAATVDPTLAEGTDATAADAAAADAAAAEGSDAATADAAAATATAGETAEQSAGAAATE